MQHLIFNEVLKT